MGEARPRMARKLVVDKDPNRLFLKYLTEWRDEASAKGDKSSYTFNKACRSLKKYPLPLQCGSEAKILENFGDKICKMLDERLAKDAGENDMTSSEFLERSRKVHPSWWKKVNVEAAVATKKPAKRKKKATPQDGSNAKKKITEPLIETYLNAPSRPVPKENLNPDTNPQVVLQNDTNINTEPQFVLRPGEFDVVLCVDTRETMGESRRKEIGAELSKQNVCYEQRTLHIGDFLWVAQQKPTYCSGMPAKELVLDYIIERKILSDLSMSIRDGRFHEQKIRLKQSGLKHIIYLIENIGDIENQSLPEQTLRQASYNTQIVDKICVKYTKNAKATVTYLDLMTKRLQRLYAGCTLKAGEPSDDTDSQDFQTSLNTTLIPFKDFNEMGSKHRKLTVKEMFIKQLMQIHGVSFDKASAIVEINKTPTHLVQTYRGLITDKEKDELLSNIKVGLTQRNLGIALSRVVRKVYSA